MSELENNPPFRNRDSNNDIAFNARGEEYKMLDGTFIKAEKDFLPLCKMCTKSPMTCDNYFIKEIEVPLEPGDDPQLEIRGKTRLPSGEMSEEKGLGFKLVDGVKTGFYKTLDDLPEPVICEFFTPKGSG